MPTPANSLRRYHSVIQPGLELIVFHFDPPFTGRLVLNDSIIEIVQAARRGVLFTRARIGQSLSVHIEVRAMTRADKSIGSRDRLDLTAHMRTNAAECSNLKVARICGF